MDESTQKFIIKLLYVCAEDLEFCIGKNTSVYKGVWKDQGHAVRSVASEAATPPEQRGPRNYEKVLQPCEQVSK